ncbi:MAG: phosphomannose isomerase type II C-terminal cupin domain [Methanobacteriaceae archaeon]
MLNKPTKSKDYKFVERPWGGYLVLEKYPDYWLKKIFIDKGEQLSLQSHRNRYEIWIVLQGKIRVQKNDAFFILQKGDYLKINENEKHRLYGLSSAVVLEAAFGQPREEDIIRYEDKYGRADKRNVQQYSAVQMFLYYDRYNLIYGWEKGLC